LVSDTHTLAEQRRVMGTLSHADGQQLNAVLAKLHDIPEWHFVRKPETGLVMIRGRIAAQGGPFNLGEATVTRAVVSLASGETGFSYALGRDVVKAEKSALIHALWQHTDYTQTIEHDVLAPLAQTQEQAIAETHAQTAPTKVDFFTLMRGDD